MILAPCTNCNVREATVNWTGNEGPLAFARGIYSRWCKRCSVEAQLKHCREAAERIPQLEAELAGLKE